VSLVRSRAPPVKGEDAKLKNGLSARTAPELDQDAECPIFTRQKCQIYDRR
jgi:hypothetical protein